MSQERSHAGGQAGRDVAGGKGPDLRLEMLSNPMLNIGARELIASVAKRLGFSDEVCGHMALAVDEALCNVERHGYGRDVQQPIWLSIFAMGGVAEHSGEPSPTSSMKIVIEDEARQIEPSEIKSRDLDEIRPGGLGVHIIREVMDEVVYEKREGKGMRLTMVKHRVVDGAGGGAGTGGKGGGMASERRTDDSGPKTRPKTGPSRPGGPR